MTSFLGEQYTCDHCAVLPFNVLATKGKLSGVEMSFEMIFPPQYPFEAPQVYFVNESGLSHPQIDSSTGLLNISILTSEWLPSLGLRNVINTIEIMLFDPYHQCD